MRVLQSLVLLTLFLALNAEAQTLLVCVEQASTSIHWDNKKRAMVSKALPVRAGKAMRLRLYFDRKMNATIFGNLDPKNGIKLRAISNNKKEYRYLETPQATIVQWTYYVRTKSHPDLLVSQKTYQFRGKVVTYTYSYVCRPPS